jgi:hypothetical protein
MARHVRVPQDPVNQGVLDGPAEAIGELDAIWFGMPRSLQ